MAVLVATVALEAMQPVSWQRLLASSFNVVNQY
jgi:hypothetical protein